MKAMPLPFEEFQGKGVFEFSSFSSSDSFPLPLLHHRQLPPPPEKWTGGEKICYVGTEPTSVLDARRSPSPPTSSSTMASRGSNSAASKSGGGGGGGDGSCSTNSTTTGAAATASENPSQAALDTSSAEKCALPVEDWGGVLSESPGQDQSILRLIMGDIEDPSSGLNNILQSSGVGSQMVDFNGGFGVVDQQGFELEPVTCVGMMSHNNTEPIFSASGTNPLMMSSSPLVFNSQPQVEDKINRNQVQFSENPSFFMPLTYPNLQEQQVFSQPQAKRLLCDTIGQGYHQVPKGPLLDSGQELFARRPPQLQLPSNPQHAHQWQSLLEPPVKQQKVSSSGDDFTTQQLQQTIIDLIFKAAEQIEAGNPVNAQGILARLNHQLSPIGKPFQRAAFYMKEALQSLLLQLNNNTNNNSLTFSPSGLVLKIGACKSFSEISPVLQFSNFTCNQALLEAVEGYDRIHMMDFDIGFGGQWASFMQELALRNGGSPSLKITAFVSPSNHDEFELSFTQEILKQYASDLSIPFELEIVSLESLNTTSWPQPLRDCEAIAVNLPIASFSHCPSYLSLVLRYLKQLMPKIVVTVDRPCDRTDAPFAQHLIYALQSYSVLLESLDAVSVNLDVLQMIEKYLVQPAMEKLVLGRHRLQLQERTPQWKTLLLTSGFSPLTLSNFTESQAECLVQRNPGRGFHVEKKQSSLVLCWQRKELISVSTWGC